MIHKEFIMKLNPHQLREVAVAACCDPRTVAAYLDGRVIRSTCAVRVERALRDLNIEVERHDTTPPRTAA